ncbi:MAG: DUF5119 domain-containing protein [Alistipes sp.]|nr:DUF5119 domain-containing protein [Alistipes senegalensis]MCM1250423.1 DUF5119 domain-containing protein [Alistipes sp.]
MKKTIRTIFAAGLLAATACEHKELCYHHAHLETVRVEFDWRYAPDADPAGMCVWFYPIDGSQPTRFDLDKHGGNISVARGDYNIIAYNNDYETIYFSSRHDFASHEIITLSGGLFEPLGYSGYPNSRGERVAVCPERLWGCTAVETGITQTGVSYICVPEKEKDEYLGVPVEVNEHVIVLYPHELCSTYTFEIHGIENRTDILRASGSLGSMSPSLLLHDESPGQELVTLPFGVEHADCEVPMTGEFLTFGHEHGDETHAFLLYIWLTDGTRWYYNIDVTDQISAAPDPRRVHLIIECTMEPQALDLDEGSNADIDDWNSEDHDLYM